MHLIAYFKCGKFFLWSLDEQSISRIQDVLKILRLALPRLLLAAYVELSDNN